MGPLPAHSQTLARLIRWREGDDKQVTSAMHAPAHAGLSRSLARHFWIGPPSLPPWSSAQGQCGGLGPVASALLFVTSSPKCLSRSATLCVSESSERQGTTLGCRVHAGSLIFCTTTGYSSCSPARTKSLVKSLPESLAQLRLRVRPVLHFRMRRFPLWDAGCLGALQQEHGCLATADGGDPNRCASVTATTPARIFLSLLRQERDRETRLRLPSELGTGASGCSVSSASLCHTCAKAPTILQNHGSRQDTFKTYVAYRFCIPNRRNKG